MSLLRNETRFGSAGSGIFFIPADFDQSTVPTGIGRILKRREIID